MSAASFLVQAALSAASGGPAPTPLPESEAEWSRLVELAVEHRISALLGRSLAQLPEAQVPIEVRGAMRAQLLRHGATRLLCENTLCTMVTALRKNGVEVMVLKGASVAHTLYASPELRIYHDLDVLCRVEDYPRLYRALRDAGFTSAGTVDARGTHETLAAKPSSRESQAVRAFYDPTGDVKVEVHFDALQLGLRDRCEQEFWRHSQVHTVNGVELRFLAPEHQFVHLACHALRHSFTRLSWLLELDLLARRPELDWRAVIRVGRAEGISAGVRYALRVVSIVFGRPLPNLPPPTAEERVLELVFRALLPPSRIAALRQHERRRLLLFQPDSRTPDGFAFGFVLAGRRREKLHALSKRYFWPRILRSTR